MSLFRHWRGVLQRAREYGVSTAFPPEIAAVVDQYADEAYRCCVRFFGPPLDPKRAHKVVQGEHSFHCLTLGVHMITISDQVTSKEQLCEIIAHEMYHRVTAGRKGLTRELWINELMATYTSRGFLFNQGLQDYAERTRKNWLATEGKADLNLLRASNEGARRYVLSGAPVYSPEFIESLARVGYALEKAVGVNAMFSIIKADTLEEWLASLPEENQYTACRVLELPADDRVVPCKDREVGKLFLALQAKGDKEALVAEFERLVHSQPANSTAFFHLGYAYQEAKQSDAAVNAYLMARDLGYTDKWLLHNLGSVYSQKKDYLTASKWYREAIQQNPDWASAHYYLGHALNQIGNSVEAQAEWKKVLPLGDEHYAKMAQKNLQENPLTRASGEE